MKKTRYTLGVISLLAASLLAGCSAGAADAPNDSAAQKPVINIEGVAAAVEEGTVTLDSGKVVLITEETQFAPDPDSDGTVSRDIAVGSFIQGYTADDPDAETVTASRIWTNIAPTGGRGGKLAVNFEGRVAAVEDGKVTLEDGRAVLTGGANVFAPDGSAAGIAVGDYIQGYAEDPEGNELAAQSILVTAL